MIRWIDLGDLVVSWRGHEDELAVRVRHRQLGVVEHQRDVGDAGLAGVADSVFVLVEIHHAVNLTRGLQEMVSEVHFDGVTIGHQGHIDDVRGRRGPARGVDLGQGVVPRADREQEVPSRVCERLTARIEKKSHVLESALIAVRSSVPIGIVEHVTMDEAGSRLGKIAEVHFDVVARRRIDRNHVRCRAGVADPVDLRDRVRSRGQDELVLAARISLLFVTVAARHDDVAQRHLALILNAVLVVVVIDDADDSGRRRQAIAKSHRRLHHVPIGVLVAGRLLAFGRRRDVDLGDERELVGRNRSQRDDLAL